MALGHRPAARAPRDYAPTVIIDGRIAGSWLRLTGKTAVAIAVTPYAALSRRDVDAIEEAVERYGSFLGRPAELKLAKAGRGKAGGRRQPRSRATT